MLIQKVPLDADLKDSLHKIIFFPEGRQSNYHLDAIYLRHNELKPKFLK